MRPATFYDEHPFDWVQDYRPEEVYRILPRLIVDAIEDHGKDRFVLDVGCGPGGALAHLTFKGIRCIGLDLSHVSLQLARGRTGAGVILADNLALPVRSGSASLVVSSGVIHHTPDPFRAFAENCRVVSPGGRLALAVYKPNGRLEFMYRGPGAAIRWAVRGTFGRRVVHSSVLPLYVVLHKVKSRGRRTWAASEKLFYDYFVTPICAFLPKAEVSDWAERCGMTVVEYDPNPAGNVHVFLLQKI